MKRIERLFNVAQKSMFNRFSELGYDRTIEAIEKLATEVNDYEGETDWSVGEGGECTLDSLLIGAYWYCADYHGGQGSAEYRLLSIIGDFFTPNCSTLERESSEFDAYVALAVLSGAGDWDQVTADYDGNDDNE